MGLLLDRLKHIELSPPPQDEESFSDEDNVESFLKPTEPYKRKKRTPPSYKTSVTFPDLDKIPPELSLQILKYLNATDLCLAACVWQSLANDDTLWQGLCKSTWGHASCYENNQSAMMITDVEDKDTTRTALNNNPNNINDEKFRNIFMRLDEATLTFNVEWRKGLDYLIREHLVDDDPMEIAKFVNSTQKLSLEQKEKLFKEKKAVLDNVIRLQNYENQFLPTALRKFFSQIKAPKDRNSYLTSLVEKFSGRFVSCNPQLDLTEDAVFILCFSLIMLSVDLSSPAVKNKMSKREFIRNTRYALPSVTSDFTGHLYDNVYLNGNIAMNTKRINAVS